MFLKNQIPSIIILLFTLHFLIESNAANKIEKKLDVKISESSIAVANDPAIDSKISSGKSKSGCRKSALAMSECMIKLMLEDIKVTYKHVGDGGITSIQLLSTKTYRMSISHEKRVDQITYEFDLNQDADLRLVKRTERSETMGR